MKGAKSLLEGLMQGGGEMGQKAKSAWDGQSVGAKGAIAGGLLGALLGGRGGLGGIARVGGAAAIGSLAAKAFADWQAGKAAAETAPPAAPGMLTDETSADDHATRLLQAMVAAAKADGHVTADEHARISERLQAMGLDDEALAMLDAELAAPLDVGRVAALATTPEEAAEIYTASLLVVDPEGAAEKGYLAMLAARLQLDPALVAHLHASTAGSA